MTGQPETPDESTQTPSADEKKPTLFDADLGEWALATCAGAAGGVAFGALLGDIPIGVSMGFAAGVFYLLFWRNDKKKST